MSQYTGMRPQLHTRHGGQVLTWQQAKASGYCIISRASSWAARIDRPDWREVLATRGLGMFGPSKLEMQRAADLYRRIVSEDRIRVPASWSGLLPNSSASEAAEYLPLAEERPTREARPKGDLSDRSPAPGEPRTVVCDYCEKAAELISGSVLYPGRGDLGSLKFWICWSCDAYVGCHRHQDNGTRPLGRLANAELRAARRATHDAFDRLWKNGRMSRSEAYAWLASVMSISTGECHIGMFDQSRCNAALSALERLEVSDDPPAKAVE